MSKPRHIWWTYAQGMVRIYPALAAALGQLHGVGMTARYGGEPAGGGPGRTTEAVAIRQLPPGEQREYDAVRAALEQIQTLPNGQLRMRMVELVYWERSHRLYAAARTLNVSERTARRWNSELVYAVAKKYGLI